MMPTPTATIYLPYSALDDVLLRGTRAAQPAASAVTPGTLYAVTDEGKVEQSNGAAWAVYGGAGSGALTPHHATHETGGTDAIAALDAGVLTTGLLPNARLAPTTQVTGSTFARLVLTDPSQAVNGRSWQVNDQSGNLSIVPVTDDLASVVASTLILDRSGNAKVGGTLSERGRTTPLGEWIDIPYSAGNFTAYPSGTWGVDSGDVVTLAYMLAGKTLWLTYLLISMSVSGSPTELRMTLPGSVAAKYTMVGQMTYREPTTWMPGYCSSASGGTYVRFQKDPDSGTAWATQTDGLRIYGTTPIALL